MTWADQIRKSHDLISQGQFDKALSIAQALVTEHPALPQAHHLLGKIWLRKKNNGKALQFAQKAHDLDKASVQTATLLAEVYVELNFPEFALPLLKTAERQQPDDAALNFVLGRCYMLMEKGHAALPHLEKAVAAPQLDPASTDARITLAECLAAIGRPKDANAVLDGIAESDPVRHAALILRGQTVGKPVPEWLVTSLTALTRSDDAEVRSSALLALGRCHDVEGRHDDAFACWTRSRDILGVQRYNRDATTRITQQTQGFYAKQLLDAAAPYGDNSSSPIFVVGMPRSGTTLTTQVISAHSTCVNIGETNRFMNYDQMFRKDFWRESGHREILQGAKGGLLRNIAQEYNRLFEIYAEGSKRRVVEKTPFNFEHLGFIRLLFPKARFIHCRRHPADNFVSAFQHSMNRSHDYSYRQDTYVERYLAHEELMRYWKQCFPDQIFELRYEDMVADQEGMSRKLVAFCGLPWEDSCLNFHEQKSTVRTFSQAQVRQPVYTSSVERWRRYEKNLGPLFAKLSQHNYDYAKSVI